MKMIKLKVTINTVKHVNKGCPREIQIMVFIDKWSLFGDFNLFNQ